MYNLTFIFRSANLFAYLIFFAIPSLFKATLVLPSPLPLVASCAYSPQSSQHFSLPSLSTPIPYPPSHLPLLETYLLILYLYFTLPQTLLTFHCFLPSLSGT